MIQESDEKIIRNHLLGNLTEEELSRAEQRLLADDDYFEMLTVIEEELIDDYVSGNLTDEDRKQFEAYFLSTPARREKLRFAQTLNEYASRTVAPVPIPTPIPRPVWWKQMFSSPYWGLAAAAAAVILIGLYIGITQIISPGPEASRGMAALKEAYRDQRPLESRITGFDHAPPPPVTRGAEQEKFDYVARDSAERIIFDAVREHPNAKSYHDLGRLYLAKHDFDKAIEQFDKALTLDDKNAQLHNDYGVALMEGAKADLSKDRADSKLEDFARALEHLNKALELNGSLLEALFNRALCHQEMGMSQQAEEDWRAYLDKDSTSQWADEAKDRLKKIEEQKQKTAQNKEELFQDFFGAYEAKDNERAWQAFSRSRSRAGNHIVERLLDTRLNLDTQGKPDGASNILRLLSYAGDLEAHRVNDRSTSHIAALYASATPNQLAVLAQARSLVKRADEESNKSNYKNAVNFYSRANEVLNRLGDDCEARYAEYRIGQCSLRQNGARSSLDIFERLAAACKSNNHKWLLALTYTSLADAYDTLGEYSKGLAYSIQALKTSEEIEDINGVARCHLQIAIGYRKVNDYRKSLAFLQHGLFDRDSLREISLRWIFYDVAAEVFKSLNLYAAAIDYQKEALQIAMEMGTPLNLSRSYAHLGFMYGKLKKYDEAIETAERAYEIGKYMSDEAIGREMMAYSSLYLGDLHRQKGDYAEALTYYDQNIDLYESLDFPLHRYATHKGKLLCFIALDDNAAAKNELETTLNLFEQYRSKILEENNRNSFFDLEQNIYDTAIDFDYSRMKDFHSAFERSESSRARSLLDLADKDARMINEGFGLDLTTLSNSQPLKLKQLQDRLPEPTQILQYAMLEDKLLIWVVSKKNVLCKEEKIELAELSKKVDRYLRRISSPSGSIEEATREAKDLYDLLIRPVKLDLDDRKYLCIVPDKALSRLPFGALVSGEGSYLVKDYFFGVCPSSTIFIKRSETARSKEGAKAEKLLAVGNPDFDRVTFQNLPSAGKEAEAVAALYKTSALTGSDARENLIKREMRNSDVIHLSTHYFADKNSYLLSAFLLAQEPGKQSESDGRLQVWEIYEMKLSRPRLAVLAACQTGVEKTYQGEGAISVARPFITAGVPVVVASLWSVESDSTSKLMISFHRHRKLGLSSTSEALCLAQREMSEGPDVPYRHPYYWASFAVIGGYATF